MRRRVARIDQHRVQLRPVRRAVLRAAGPGIQHRVVVEASDPLPGPAAILASGTVPAARCRRTRRRARSRGRGSARTRGRPPGRARRGRLRGTAGPGGPPPARSCRNPSSETRSGRDGRCWRAISNVRRSRGSSTTWWMMWPRKCGPSSRHRRGVACSNERALARATSNATVAGLGARARGCARLLAPSALPALARLATTDLLARIMFRSSPARAILTSTGLSRNRRIVAVGAKSCLNSRL